MRILCAIVAILTLAGSAQADPFSDNFDVVGTLQITIAGTDATMFVPYDKTRNRPFVRAQDLGGTRSVSIMAASPTATGAPGNPMVQLFFVAPQGHAPKDITLRLTDEQGTSRPLLSTASLGQNRVTEFEETDDGQVRIGFSATLIRVDVSKSMTNPDPIEGEPTVDVQGALAFSLQPPEG